MLIGVILICIFSVFNNFYQISFSAKEADVAEWKGDILAVGVTEKDMVKDENSKFENVILKQLDSKLGGLLAEASSEEDFTGKVGQSTVLRIPGLGSKRVGLIGLGQSVLTTAAFRGFGEAVAAAAKSAQANSVAIVLASPEGISGDSKPNTASAIATGICFLSYQVYTCAIDICLVIYVSGSCYI